jgi:hypothetical protein
VSGQLHAPAVLPHRKEFPVTNWVGGCVGPRAYHDSVEESSLPGIEPQFTDLQPALAELSRFFLGETVALKYLHAWLPIC